MIMRCLGVRRTEEEKQETLSVLVAASGFFKAERIREISGAIKEGALAFLGREYRILAIFVVVVAIILGVIPLLGLWVALFFVFGAFCSGQTGTGLDTTIPRA